jgi:TolB-like protein/Tfp pilus assembly protein PilF
LAEGNEPDAAHEAGTGTSATSIDPHPSAVFISYASQDSNVATALVAALERQGVACWIAPRDVKAGALYADAIVRAISGAKALVLVLSRNAVASSHVGKEVERASSKKRPIIALRIDTAPLTPALEYFLGGSQWVEAPTGNMEAACVKLIEAIREPDGLAPGSIAAVTRGASTATASAPAPKSSRIRILLVVGLAVVAMALAALLADKLLLSKHSTLDQAAGSTPATTAPVTAAFNPPPHSIAVLPFANMSGDAKQDYFSDGISEELLNSLARLNGLQVVARTSSFSFKGQNVDVSTVAHKLNVGAVLEGSVRRAGNTVRITVQLINAVSGFHMWSQTYDRSLTDILKIQTEVATSVADHLEITLAGDEAAKIDAGGTKSPEAFEAYLRGMELLSNGDTDEKDFRAALAALDQAIALDPNFAQAHAKRASTLTDIAVFVAKQGEVARLREQALQAAERAVALAPALGEAHLALAEVRSYGLLDFTDAAPQFDRALVLSPGSAPVQRGFAGFAGQLGHFESAVNAAHRAVGLDPQNVDSYITLGQVLVQAHHYDEALAAFRAAAVLRPNAIFIKFMIANAMLASGQFEKARELCESTSIPPQSPGRHLLLALAYHGLGRQRDAEIEVAQFKAVHGDASLELASVYAQLGQTAAALEEMAKAWRQRDSAFQGLRVAWQFDPIRNEPQFKAIEAKLNFPP